MAFTKEQRATAKEKGWPLVSINAGGIQFSGPVPPELHEKLVRYTLDFIAERRAKINELDGKEAEKSEWHSEGN